MNPIVRFDHLSRPMIGKPGGYEDHEVRRHHLGGRFARPSSIFGLISCRSPIVFFQGGENRVRRQSAFERDGCSGLRDSRRGID